MKYNYIISIFLLIFVIIISQAVYVYEGKKIIEGSRNRRRRNIQNPFRRLRNWFNPNAEKWFNPKAARQRKRAEEARRAAEAARAKYKEFMDKFINPRQTPYVNLLGQAYVTSVNPSGKVGVPYLDNSETQANLIAYQEAIQVETLANQTNASNSDDDIAKIIMLTSNILSGNGKNSTKVYFISEVILKAFGHFYGYDIKNNEKQANYLFVQFPITFKDDDDIKKKYSKFFTLLALAHISKSTTSTSLSPGSNAFLYISSPIILEATNIINDLKNIKYGLSEDEKREIQNKYTTIVK
jgi:hypothetical protein